jgi:hypothetical protein
VREVQAEPVLQLDIIGGRYDAATQTVISDGPVFTLIALLTPKSPGDLAGTYFVSMALTPQTALQAPAPNYGSFLLNGQSIAVTEDMNWGVPPVEDSDLVQEHDGNDLATHSVYPTYFYEHAFTFAGATASGTYNTQDNPGGPIAGTGSYYVAFSIDTRGMQTGYGLHFDLYDTFFKEQCSGPNRTRVCTTDEGIDHFAPFSHDAAVGDPLPPPPAPVPEPGSILLLGSALALSARRMMRRTQQ